MFCFKPTVVLGFFSYTLLLEISPEEEVLRLGTLVPMNVEVPTKYQLSLSDRIVVFENRLHSKSSMLYRLALHGNWTVLSLASRALEDKFPMLTVPLTTVLQNRRVFLPDGFGGLQVACWPLVPKFAGSNPAEAVGFLRAKKSSARLPSEWK
jgi:hypothetical protein